MSGQFALRPSYIRIKGLRNSFDGRLGGPQSLDSVAKRMTATQNRTPFAQPIESQFKRLTNMVQVILVASCH